MNKLQEMNRILETNSGKYLLAYLVKDNKEIQRGLPVYINKKKAKQAARDMVKDIDVIITCWVEKK